MTRIEYMRASLSATALDLYQVNSPDSLRSIVKSIRAIADQLDKYAPPVIELPFEALQEVIDQADNIDDGTLVPNPHPLPINPDGGGVALDNAAMLAKVATLVNGR